MKTFSGFPSGKVRIVGIPKPVFTELIPAIDDLAELKLTLHVLWRLRQQRGKVRCLRFGNLVSDQLLLSSLGEAPVEALRSALNRAVERGTLLRAAPPDGSEAEKLYFANTPRGRAAVEAISRGMWPEEVETTGRPNIFTLYEQNIGTLTPLIAEELREAEQTYPTAWIEEAFREAVTLNKRSWKYIHAILDRWHTEGKDDGPRSRSDEADRRQYLEWKHGRD
ncbi:MAG: DnaD domain protein [Anaerolineae bacterium]|jgi:DnaD/phage-associated family protein